MNVVELLLFGRVPNENIGKSGIFNTYWVSLQFPASSIPRHPCAYASWQLISPKCAGCISPPQSKHRTEPSSSASTVRIIRFCG